MPCRSIRTSANPGKNLRGRSDVNTAHSAAADLQFLFQKCWPIGDHLWMFPSNCLYHSLDNIRYSCVTIFYSTLHVNDIVLVLVATHWSGSVLVLLVIAEFLLLIVEVLSIAESEVLADNIENTDHVTEDNDDNDTVDSDE